MQAAGGCRLLHWSSVPSAATPFVPAVVSSATRHVSALASCKVPGRLLWGTTPPGDENSV
eukprot:6454961-Prymnesium_polylepis.1